MFFPKKYLSLVFYKNRDLKISKSKISEQYFRDKIEIFIRLFDEHFACHFHWRETWRHTSRRTVPQISLETPPPPPPESEEKRNVTSRYYGSKISRSQQSFLTEAAICTYRTMEEKYKRQTFVPECNHAQKSDICQFFSAIITGPRIAEIQKFCYRGRGGWFLLRWITLSARRCYLFP